MPPPSEPPPEPPPAPPTPPPSQRRFWTMFFVAGFAIGLLLHWRGLPLVLIPETSAALAFIAAGLVEKLVFKGGGF